MREHVGQLVRADDVAQGRLGRQNDRQVEILDFKDRLLGIHTIQKQMASTLTGTVSLVRVDSELKSVERIRISTIWAMLSMMV